MTIQFNTDKTVKGEERQREYFVSQITEELERFHSRITRIEVHLSDENGIKEGVDDIRCLMEARLKGRQPLAVTNQSDTVEQAVSGAINKLKNSLETILKRNNRQ